MDRREATRVIKELLADRDNDSRYPCVSSPRHYEALDLAIEALQEPKVSEDCISRQHAVEDIKEHANTITDALIILENFPPVTPKVSEDCISRANLPKKLNGVVLDNCDKIVDEFLEEHECDELWNVVRALRDFYDWTMDAPSVTPTERTGEWIVYPLKDEGRVELECSECGNTVIGAISYKPNFCENCGAIMESEKLAMQRR